MKCGVGYIAMDDAEILKQCICPWGGIAVVHGSSDGGATRKLFEERGYFIVDRQWDNNYANARNLVIEVAQEMELDALFILDCDESFPAEQVPVVCEKVLRADFWVGLLPRLNLLDETKINNRVYPDFTMRVINLSKGLKYTGEVHEWLSTPEGLCLGLAHPKVVLLLNHFIVHYQYKRPYAKTWLRQHNYGLIAIGQEPLKEAPAGVAAPNWNPAFVSNFVL